MRADLIRKSLTFVPVALFFLIAVTILCNTAGISAAPRDRLNCYFDDKCAWCHVDDDPTCDGCHFHGDNPLTASVDKAVYGPGEEIVVTLDGGRKYGWGRGMLTDSGGTEVDRRTGPSFTGNDGGRWADMPMEMRGRAPGETGTHTWTAQFYAHDYGTGKGHTTTDVPVTIVVAATSDLVVDLVPAATPMLFGPAGGVIDFDLDLLNTTASPVSFDIWFDVTLPNGHQAGPILGPLHATLPAGAGYSRSASLPLPATVPPGIYSFNVYTGEFASGTLLDADSFAFAKSSM